jgi:hypothetical protein
MKKLIMFVFLVALAAQPAWLGAQGPPTDVLTDVTKDKKVKSVPEPSTILLAAAAAAGLVGVRKLLRSKRR